MRFEKNEEDSRNLDVMFDLTEAELGMVLSELPTHMHDSIETMNGSLPEWAKRILVRLSDSRGGGDRFNGRSDRFGGRNERSGNFSRDRDSVRSPRRNNNDGYFER